MYGVETVEQLRREGLSRRQLDSLPRVEGFTGVRLRGEPPEDPRLPRIGAAVLLAPPGAVLAGWAAAAVHGVPDEFLDGRVNGRRLRPVDFAVPRPMTDYERSGLRLRRTSVAPVHQVHVEEVPVTSPARTALDLARWCRSDARRLAMLDLSIRHGLVTPEEFDEFIAPLGGFHGLNSVRPLVGLASGLAESVPESELRWRWVQAGLPEPQVNAWIMDEHDTTHGRADLFEPVDGLVVEYQGFWHRRHGAAEHDKARREVLESLNITVVEIWKDDMGTGVVEAKLLQGMRDARARDVRLDAWRWRPGTFRPSRRG